MLAYCQLDPRIQISVNIESKYIISIQENAFENVDCKMVIILVDPNVLKGYHHSILPSCVFEILYGVTSAIINHSADVA